MPAKNKKQLKRAYAGARRGEKWAKRMIAHTPRKKRKSLMKG